MRGRLVRMNYNNFSCRLVARRPAAVSIEKTPPTPNPKKARKAVRRRLISALAMFAAVLGIASMELHAAEDLREAAGPTATAFATKPAGTHISKLTMLLIAGGLGVACFQAGRIFRRDLLC